MAGFDMFQHFGDGLKLRENLEIKFLFSFGHVVHRHIQPMFFVERGYDFGYRHASPGVEEIFAEFAAPFRERFAPGNVVKRHGIGDGAVTIEEVTLEGSRRQLESHG